ncbi:MAG TPA: glycoside hydrolase family 32 protein [Chitinophagaceae bacterium]|nr:glycoside hydrolase family 32 protein [Chitinophagaceae bacterium]
MIKFIVPCVACILLISTRSLAQQEKTSQPKPAPFDTIFKAEKRWMVFPVKNGATKRKVELWIDGKLCRYIDIELAEGQADWLSYLDISEWKGKDLDLRVNLLSPGAKTFSATLQSDTDTNEAPLYKEKLRGQFHFSPKRGWTNDPNGLAYYNGEYHLFFQHNPYGTEWGNMHWGHAVSKDLLHWKELGEALYPDETGTMFSGSGVVDSNNTSGLGKDGKAPMVLFYTSDRSWTQGLAWTTDGRTFEKSDRAAVPRFSMGNRDPKVIWHEPTKKWIMVYYAEANRQLRSHTMRFYTSPNLKDWTFSSSIKGGQGRDNYLFECPEFFELPVEGNPAQRKWILTGANNEYAIGNFDGKVFTPEVERLKGERGRDFYASQTFNNEPNGRRIEIGWWRTRTNKEGMTFNQSQSIPLEIKLVNSDSGLRLSRTPVKELESLRMKTFNIGKATLAENGTNPLAKVNAGALELRAALEPGKSREITFSIHGKTIVYDVDKKQLTCDGVNAPAPLKKGRLGLIIYADRTGFEIFTEDGLLFMPVNVNLDMNDPLISVSAKGGRARINNLAVYELKSIWDDQ